KKEDIRFTEGVANLIQHRNVINAMLRIYFECIFTDKTAEQLGGIQKILMAANVHISASSLTKEGFSLVVAAAVSWGKILSADMSVLAGRTAGVAVSVVGLYGVVQKAADSANRLHVAFPSYYSALYSQGLEMMYFLIEPLFKRFDSLNVQHMSDSDIANMIINMTGYHG
ncbi:hypothetical protein, partial [Enterobacter asburiae]|uniref:hypothetical protein n=1 Tax=Enterobacter asburiae TaxID=61645 RepID=UPI003F577B8E